MREMYNPVKLGHGPTNAEILQAQQNGAGVLLAHSLAPLPSGVFK
jgi:hypothetical protein